MRRGMTERKDTVSEVEVCAARALVFAAIGACEAANKVPSAWINAPTWSRALAFAIDPDDYPAGRVAAGGLL